MAGKGHQGCRRRATPWVIICVRGASRCAPRTSGRNQLYVPHVLHALGQHLLIYRAEPGSDSARALAELRSLAGSAS